MHIRGHVILISGVLTLPLGCAGPPPEPEPIEEPRSESPPAPEPEVDRSEEIQSRNEEILERLRLEQLSRERLREAEPDSPPSIETIADEGSKPSGMDEMRARADELEPRMAAIGRIADRLDENYRRYLDACHEKYTAAAASPHTVQPHYYDPYQPLVISNETTPICRKLWSDIERDAEDIELEMRAVSEDARRRGVLPGHLRDLARKYGLDRNGWRP